MNETLPERAAVATAPATLAMRGITKTYGGVAALSDVSVEIAAGEVHAILGENGAGKSTLMNVATGGTQPDAGTILVAGEDVGALSPRSAAAHGIAIVHQHPAVLPDLTVLENLEVALPASVLKGEGGRAASARRILERVGLDVDLRDRVELMTVAQRHLLEIAKAFAVEPRVLILDEPTAPLGDDAVRHFFSLVRDAVGRGTSVVYITHRMAEVRELADRVTVLRDGRTRGTALVADVTDDELLSLIVGRKLDSTFPPKLGAAADEAFGHDLELVGLSGPGFAGIDAKVRRGAIVGIAGVVGNGQTDLLRALAGLEQFDGEVRVGGTARSGRELLRRAAYMPSDRHGEGLAMSLSVRENAAISALKSFTAGPLLRRPREVETVGGSLRSLAVKAPSMDAPVGALSGGNQQKVVISRALLSDPVLLIADEPTQGVDVGARAEIYGILREASSRGIPVVVASSDTKELEGLCDQVLVMSRGQVVATLEGDDITEERMVSAAVGSKATAIATPEALRPEHPTGLRRFVQSDFAPSVLVAALIVVLGAFIAAQNGAFLSTFNLVTILTAATAVGFLALGQNIALLTGGIDLSVGPLAGFLVVVASFFVNDGKPVGTVLLGLGLMLLIAIAVGLVNGGLIRGARFTPIAATLALYIALGGFALLLRPEQGGYISQDFQSFVTMSFGPIPLFFIVLVVVAVLLELALRRTRWGWRLRAAGSDEVAARTVGVAVDRTVVLGYVATAALVFLSALMFMGQYGVGDPTQGSAFTLTSITAVVLGGTSLLGGRGTFIGPLLGALLLQQVLSATVFLGLGTVFQYYFQGALILVAAIVYTTGRIRRRRRRAAVE
ncbi:ATP-binding cassette domain-containing protein [Amnibacterium kyonggiense]|uniref:Ribose transport system ATP-binding protein n=1 Tax=Amnibacterium kyonggiense TaxID=595671 RepID=A0A4R7FE97_9MICO|nr:ATP-binding cassette domain-containing protein [Amnibacterium kyonggiense]TDS75649.1 ribose transport system ATP-binding protein [Amnibacterium kyonggiense]